jgi:hypothetical protein
MPESFTVAERNLIRFEFMFRWGGFRSLSEGIFLHRWVGGPHKGQPKLKKAVQSMLDRGLVGIVDPDQGSAYAQFTMAGLEALQAMAGDRRFLPPDQYGHLLEELEAFFSHPSMATQDTKKRNPRPKTPKTVSKGEAEPPATTGIASEDRRKTAEGAVGKKKGDAPEAATTSTPGPRKAVERGQGVVELPTPPKKGKTPQRPS